MFYSLKVRIPADHGNVYRHRIRGIDYIDYTYDRVYKADKHYNVPKRTTIGKVCKDDSEMMNPNQNYYRFFGEKLPESLVNPTRSSCLHIGSYIVLEKILHEMKMGSLLGKVFQERRELFEDLMAYSIVTENNAAEYYPDYAYSHPLFTEDMHVYNDSSICDFFHSITDDDRIRFQNLWNEINKEKDGIYISYDSTNKVCKAGDVEIVEVGHAKGKTDDLVLNYSIGYDASDMSPLFYESYPGSIVDVAQLHAMVDKAYGYGYRKIGFILDRGYFSEANLQEIDRLGFEAVIMVKGKKALVNSIVKRVRGTFEEKRACHIPEYEVNGITERIHLFPADKRDRFLHIYYNPAKYAAERAAAESRIDRVRKELEKYTGKSIVLGRPYTDYFDLIYSKEKEPVLLCAREKSKVIEEEISYCGYFAIITSQKMSAREALLLYKSRDASEKLFRDDKSYLGNRSIRAQSTISAEARILVEFAALIIRHQIYRRLKEAMIQMEKKPNFMTVPSAIRELEKIEITRQTDGRYRMDHAITKTQKIILQALGISAQQAARKAEELSIQLYDIDKRAAETQGQVEVE